MSLYERIKQLCIKEGIEISNLGKVVGISLNKSTISQWQHGATPRRGTVKAIADFFGVSVEYLMNGAEPEKATQPKAFALSESEAALISLFRQLNAVQQARLLTSAAEMAETLPQ